MLSPISLTQRETVRITLNVNLEPKIGPQIGSQIPQTKTVLSFWGSFLSFFGIQPPNRKQPPAELEARYNRLKSLLEEILTENEEINFLCYSSWSAQYNAFNLSVDFFF